MKTILVDAYNTFILADQGVNKAMYQLLETYPNRKIVLTNANDDEMVSLGINNSPYEVYTLKHNPNKPNPKYYETLLSHFELHPENVIYFEHNADAVTSAQSVGIVTFHYNKDTNDLDALKVFIDSNL